MKCNPPLNCKRRFKREASYNRRNRFDSLIIFQIWRGMRLLKIKRLYIYFEKLGKLISNWMGYCRKIFTRVSFSESQPLGNHLILHRWIDVYTHLIAVFSRFVSILEDFLTTGFEKHPFRIIVFLPYTLVYLFIIICTSYFSTSNLNNYLSNAVFDR